MPNTNRDQKNKCNNEYYHRNKERILEKLKETSKEYYANNREKLLINSKVSRERHYESQILRSTKAAATRRGLEFNLTIEDIIIPDYCKYLETPLTRKQGQGRVWTNASIDRIDNMKGYVKGNTQIISLKANLMKAHSSAEELLTFAKNVVKMNEQITEILND
jgi:hypothetical protein